MKRYFLVFVVFCMMIYNGPVISQPYQVGHISITMVDSSRNNRQIPAEVYYPALAAGEEVPVVPGLFPVLSFGHGFVMTIDAYSNFTSELVPQGYIFVLANTETGISPVHANLALDLAFIIHYMKLENADPGSLFHGSVSQSSAVMGHSMGGGASVLAAAGDTSISAMVNFAAANTNPSAILASADILVPALLFSGSEDCVAPPSQHQQPIYDSLASSCKTLVNITGGGHCYFANDNFLCTFGENSCSPNLTITREEQQDITFNFLGPWLDFILKGNAASWEIFSDSLASSGRITYEQDCDHTFINDNGRIESDLKVFPVPFRDYFTVDGNSIANSVKVYDITGREVFSGNLEKKMQACFPAYSLKPGIYSFVFILEDGRTLTRKSCKF